MSITDRDQLLDAFGNGAGVNFPINKASIANQLAGAYTSLWRAAGQPGAGAIPSTPAVCDSTTPGAIPFSNPVAPVKTYLGRLSAVSGSAGTQIELHDRLAHMGGLSGTVFTPTSQPVNLDLTGVSAARIGAADFSELQWWAEWYQDTGATPVTATFAITLDDNSTTTSAVSLAATVRASRLLPIPSPTAGRYIKSVQSVTLSASTGGAGSFGVTVTRPVANIQIGLANTGASLDWAALGFPQIQDDACLTLMLAATGTASGVVYGAVRLVQG